MRKRCHSEPKAKNLDPSVALLSQDDEEAKVPGTERRFPSCSAWHQSGFRVLGIGYRE